MLFSISMTIADNAETYITLLTRWFLGYLLPHYHSKYMGLFTLNLNTSITYPALLLKATYTLVEGGGYLSYHFWNLVYGINTQTHILLKNWTSKSKSKVEEYRFLIPIFWLRVMKRFKAYSAIKIKVTTTLHLKRHFNN